MKFDTAPALRSIPRPERVGTYRKGAKTRCTRPVKKNEKF